MKNFKKVLFLIIFVVIQAFGISLTLKAYMGYGPVDALNQTISHITLIKVGNISILMNMVCFVLQIILQGRNTKLLHFLTVPVTFLLGTLVNIFYYDVLVFQIGGYIQQLILFSLGTLITAFCVAALMNINLVTFPVEGFCNALAEKTSKSFVFYRQAFDVVMVIASLSISLIFNSQIMLREGSILSMIVFSPIIGFSMKIQENTFKKLGILGK